VEIVPMTAEYAADIITWRYAPPYDCYDMTEADPAFITSEAGGYFALADGGALIGFRSFGADGQVPGGRYDASALDTGRAFRVTVARFNARALRVVESLGFRREDSFTATSDGRDYQILRLTRGHRR
jgi:[ribosomal protein S18]-alanine N-acetyltransferase